MNANENRYEQIQDNLAFWNSVAKTDPDKTKSFNRGGYHGTSVSPLYVISKVTREWGPIGLDWGFDEVERVVQDNGLWFVKVRVWYKRSLFRKDEEGVAEIFQWGGDHYAGVRSTGSAYLDDEAPKKALTDGLTKCLTYLGFCADVHLGLHDDDKYVASLRREKEIAKKNATSKPAQGAAPKQPAQEEAQQQPPARQQARPEPSEASAQLDANEEEVIKNLPLIDGVQYTSCVANNGQHFVRADGNTRGKNELLKGMGFKWSNPAKAWFLPIQ